MIGSEVRNVLRNRFIWDLIYLFSFFTEVFTSLECVNSSPVVLHRSLGLGIK